MRVSRFMKGAAAVCTVSAMILLGTVSAANAADGTPDPATTPVVTVAPSPSPDPASTAPAPEAPAPEAPAPETSAPAAPVATEPAAPTPQVKVVSANAKLQTNNSTSSQSSTNKKVFVCKYVGTPGVDERLQTGNNPISVSVSAIQHNQWDGTVPGYFSDAHNRSYVLAYDTGQPDPNVSECPTPVGPPTAKVCTDSGSLTWTKNTDLSQATVTLKKGFSSCDVSLSSYETQGATWETSGTQTFVDYATVHLTKNNPTATLKVNVQGCFQQQDLYIGTTVYDGQHGTLNGVPHGALPHYPSSSTPNGLIDHWNGAGNCTPPPPPVHTQVTPTYDSSTYTCNTTTYTVEGANTLTLTGQTGVVWTITKGSDTQTLAAGAGFNGLPPYGVGTYTINGADASSSDLVDVTPVTATVTFVTSDSLGCTAPPVVVAPSATISSVCSTAGGSDVSIHLEAGTSDTTFQILVGGVQVDQETVKAGGSFDYSTTLAEDSSGGSTTVQVKSGATDVTDAVAVTTDCLPPVVVPVTPDNVWFNDGCGVTDDSINVPGTLDDGSFTVKDSPSAGDSTTYSSYSEDGVGGYLVTDTTTKDGVRTATVTFIPEGGPVAEPGADDTYTIVTIDGHKYAQWTYTFTNEKCSTTPTPTPTPTTPTTPTHPVTPAGGANTGLSGSQPGMSSASFWNPASTLGLSGALFIALLAIGAIIAIRIKRNRSGNEAGVEGQ